MFSCFTVKNRNEKKLPKPPNASSTESPLDSPIDEIRRLSLLWSMGSQIPEEGTNNLGHTVAPANPADSYPAYFNQSIKNHDYVIAPSNPECTTPGDDCVCHFKSNRTHSRQKSSVTRPDKLVVASTKPWGDQILEGHDYVNMTATPGNGSPIHSKSNRTHSRQKSSVTRPGKLPVVSSKTLANQTIENLDYVVMQGGPKGTTPGDQGPLHPTPNDTHSPQRSSKIRLLDEVVADIEKLAKEIDQCFPSSADKSPASQQSNTVTEINHELLRALQKQREKIDINDSAQTIASPLSQQMAAMEPPCSFSGGPFNIKPHPAGKTHWPVTVAGNGNQ